MARKSTSRTPRTKKPASRGKTNTEVETNLIAPDQVVPDKADIKQIRVLAHDLSNSLEAILQASYLLNQAKLDSNSKRWVQLIDSASQDAARLNRELRKHLRAICED